MADAVRTQILVGGSLDFFSGKSVVPSFLLEVVGRFSQKQGWETACDSRAA